MFNDIRDMNSKYMYPLIHVCCGDVSDDERIHLKDRVVALSIHLIPLHETLAILASAQPVRQSIAVADANDLELSIFLEKIEKGDKPDETALQRALRRSPLAVLAANLSKEVDSSTLLDNHEWLQSFAADLLDTSALVGSLDHKEGQYLADSELIQLGQNVDLWNYDSDADEQQPPTADTLQSPRSVQTKACNIMSRLDTNGDGLVSREEFVAGGGTAEEFERWDRDGSGSLDFEEIQAMMAAEQEHVQVKALSIIKFLTYVEKHEVTRAKKTACL